MTRREFTIGLASAVISLPTASVAQQNNVGKRIGALMFFSSPNDGGRTRLSWRRTFWHLDGR